jgi:hypothetical protein
MEISIGSAMQLEHMTQCLGIGVVTDHGEADITDAVQITTFLLRSFAHAAGWGGDIALDDYLSRATRRTEAIGGKFMLELITLPALGALRLPGDHLAVFTLTTKYWRRGRPYVIRAADKMVAEYLGRTRRAPDQVAIRRAPYTRERRYFAYQVLLKETA